MADLIHNIAKGRWVQFGINVDTNTPTNSAFILSVWEGPPTGGATDDQVRDADTVAAVEALTGLTERVTSGWTRKTLVDVDVTIILDDTNNNHRVDVPDQTWTAVSAGVSTDVGFSYDADTTAGADTDLTPSTWHDFAITPDSSDVTVQIHADGIGSAA